ncbi:MAG: CRISPR-associated ring nuclease Csm6 [Smithella sp.]|nr:CRISPR-associated ring nuclease Csm6 [Smithella sp.]
MPNILLAISGLSPQVVTETLYALHQDGIRVDEIHVLTTRTGRDRVLASLLTPQDGSFHRYLNEYEIDPSSILFTPESVHVLRDTAGRPLDDITCADDNEILLKTCLALAHRLTKRPEDTVFFSIAGGRKTMSACLMTAAQFYGRPQDRIYHVLVSPEFENHPGFYYPPVKPVMLEMREERGGKILRDTASASVTLVPIPFISLRDAIRDRATGRVQTPARLLRHLIREKEEPLIVDLMQGRIIYKRKELPMMPSRLALYAFLAGRKLDCRLVRAGCGGCTDCYLDYEQISNAQAVITDIYRKIGGTTEGKGICALEKDELRAYVSKIRQDIGRAFGATAAGQLAVTSAGRKPGTRYGIGMDREKIKLIK